ncbi:HET-domain-containing protein, partial [Stipitochalara longipes BDJ]
MDAALKQGEIRLLHLQPGGQEDPIECDLIHSGQHTESYEALSYMWGPPSPCQAITVNGVACSVRQNLFAALQSLRNRREMRVLWVDALCINQDNIPERSAQVAMMSRIYRAAAKVLVWLGPASIDSHIAFEYVDECRRWIQANLRVCEMISEEQEIAFMSILERDYWRRVWIIQEIL